MDEAASQIKSYVDRMIHEVSAVRKNLDEDWTARQIRDAFHQLNDCAKAQEAFEWRLAQLERRLDSDRKQETNQ